ncbi:cupin domain-containing protein [Carbonactinospora thermoautotrophica]|uniref:ChrR-like cupin domain-containing protein n=1 Tax=Carbonactinospora thermoautotrophica TaxID=1469144 RepID=A0A132MK75_9ACTN|nr:cupin domain-containing protein [Carbonactinospora thermoautotrophica]KWW98149.1 hypothetical protein TH66_23160 [Carbonactinospora thermoautotrophica]KWX02831.1 hypothetical protein LI90_3878 [Carbonactinospora thermoautotrophica]KWX09569.1 hypothetical protein TR74_08820 [Carbonactinospora thermoautotrophica]MCX9192738.1 cupin domain-containing protein [Carbonactinospora thermoautotrophica]
MTQTTPATRGKIYVLDATAVEALEWRPLRGQPDVKHKALWQSGELVVGLLWLEPGASEPGHAHPDADHHVWVVEGTARIGGRLLTPGSYAYVPAGTDHEITDVGAGGCTLFYTFRPHGEPARH